MSHEKDDNKDLDIQGELVERPRRECKKDHSRDKFRVDELDRKIRNSHKNRIRELQEEDIKNEEEEEYKHLWK